MLKNSWRSVMDPNKNALKGLPKPVKFQLMVVLSLMWSAIFCASAGVLSWLPGYVFVHVALIAIGLFGTSWIFKQAESNRELVHVAPPTKVRPDEPV
jgi:hypothetical protein